MTIIKTICAWCGKDMGQKDGKGISGVSHSMCKDCAKKFEQGAKKLSKLRIKRRIICFIAHKKDDIQSDIWTIQYRFKQRFFPGHWYWLVGNVFHFNRECAEVHGSPRRLHPDKSIRYGLCDKCSKRFHRMNVVKADEINDKMPEWVLELNKNVDNAHFDSEQEREFARQMAIGYMGLAQMMANMLAVDVTGIEDDEL